MGRDEKMFFLLERQFWWLRKRAVVRARSLALQYNEGRILEFVADIEIDFLFLSIVSSEYLL
jgi:hypothetical protein